MVERNEKGKQARRYFIECERQLHAAKASPLLLRRWLIEIDHLGRERVIPLSKVIRSHDSGLTTTEISEIARACIDRMTEKSKLLVEHNSELMKKLVNFRPVP